MNTDISFILIYYTLMYLAKNNKISAVIDWGNAMYGDFLYDLANFTFWAPLHPAIQKIDWATIAKQYFIEKGIEIQDFEKRLCLCELHIGLAGMAWNAHNKNWKELEATTKRIADLVKNL
jgi:hygromycin-B 4-O-kinase